MYIVAKLPASYGRFHQLQEENYPFRRAFERYLEAIAALGLALDADPRPPSASSRMPCSRGSACRTFRRGAPRSSSGFPWTTPPSRSSSSPPT